MAVLKRLLKYWVGRVAVDFGAGRGAAPNPRRSNNEARAKIKQPWGARARELAASLVRCSPRGDAPHSLAIALLPLRATRSSISQSLNTDEIPAGRSQNNSASEGSRVRCIPKSQTESRFFAPAPRRPMDNKAQTENNAAGQSHDFPRMLSPTPPEQSSLRRGAATSTRGRVRSPDRSRMKLNRR